MFIKSFWKASNYLESLENQLHNLMELGNQPEETFIMHDRAGIFPSCYAVVSNIPLSEFVYCVTIVCEIMSHAGSCDKTLRCLNLLATNFVFLYLLAFQKSNLQS